MRWRPAVVSCVGASWVVASIGLAAACGRDDRVIREWRPEDHVEPGGGESSGQAAPAEATGSPAEQEARAVAALYTDACAGCHGERGEGDGAERPPGAQMPSFGAADWQASRTDEQIAQVILEGRGLMPAFGTQISPRGIALLVRHVRALGGARPTPAAPPAAAPPAAAPPAAAPPAAAPPAAAPPAAAPPAAAPPAAAPSAAAVP